MVSHSVGFTGVCVCGGGGGGAQRVPENVGEGGGVN